MALRYLLDLIMLNDKPSAIPLLLSYTILRMTAINNHGGIWSEERYHRTNGIMLGQFTSTALYFVIESLAYNKVWSRLTCLFAFKILCAQRCKNIKYTRLQNVNWVTKLFCTSTVHGEYNRSHFLSFFTSNSSLERM